MKIALNARFLLKDRLEGIGWFTHETAKRLVQRNPDIEFHFLFDRKFDEQFVYGPNVVPHVIAPQARHPILWKTWFEYSVPRKLKKIGADMFLSADGYLSLKTDVPSHLVVHDLAFEHYPEDLSKSVANYYRKYTPKFVHKASRVATVSQFSAADIEANYDLNPGSVDVLYNGINEKYGPLEQDAIQLVRDEYARSQPYFLFVGAMHPRKNIVRLLKAFDLFKRRTGSPFKLVMVGRKGWGTSEMEAAFESMEYKDDVIFTGRLTTRQLRDVLASAFAMTYVPYFEGFGIPIVESQQCGVPVITSNVSSMPEVVGEAGLTVDPFSEEDIAAKMTVLYTDPHLHGSLRAKCFANTSNFSWENTTDRYWQSIQKLGLV